MIATDVVRFSKKFDDQEPFPKTKDESYGIARWYPPTSIIVRAEQTAEFVTTEIDPWVYERLIEIDGCSNWKQKNNNQNRNKRTNSRAKNRLLILLPAIFVAWEAGHFDRGRTNMLLKRGRAHNGLLASCWLMEGRGASARTNPPFLFRNIRHKLGRVIFGNLIKARLALFLLPCKGNFRGVEEVR